MYVDSRDEAAGHGLDKLAALGRIDAAERVLPAT
jgi:hypothetical protein